MRSRICGSKLFKDSAALMVSVLPESESFINWGPVGEGICSMSNEFRFKTLSFVCFCDLRAWPQQFLISENNERKITTGFKTMINGRVRHAIMMNTDTWTSTDIEFAVWAGSLGSKLIDLALECRVCERSSTELSATSSKQHPEDRRCRPGSAYGLNLKHRVIIVK